MKRITIAASALVAAALASLASCSTTEKLGFNTSTKTGLSAIPEEALSAAYAIAPEEQNATVTFASAHNAPWSLGGGQYYVQDGSVSTSVLRGSENVTQTAVELLSADDSDKIAAVDLKLNASDAVTTISFDVSDNGNMPQNLSQSIVTLRVYVPTELAYNNDDGFNGIINFRITDASGTAVPLTGSLKDVSFQDIGTGWKTITLNLAYQTYFLGRKTGTFDIQDAAALTRAKSLDITIQGKSVGSNLDVPLLIDWLDFAALPDR